MSVLIHNPPKGTIMLRILVLRLIYRLYDIWIFFCIFADNGCTAVGAGVVMHDCFKLKVCLLHYKAV